VGFESSFAFGKVAESQIAKWLQARGNHILPVYEKESGEYKGPVLNTPDGLHIICPDMLAISKHGIAWIEAKHKSAFTYSKKYSNERGYDVWNTGIDLKHYNHYTQLQKELPHIPVWLMFLHQDGTAKDTPLGKVSPTGLFMAPIRHLQANECHQHPNGGKNGMVYWDHRVFIHVPLDEFMERSAIMEFDGGMTTDESILSAKLAYAESTYQ
jgi:hypothetical protein